MLSLSKKLKNIIKRIKKFEQNKINEDNWLLKYKKNIASQNGEDGILKKIFEIIGEKNKWCVEFGAWNGKLFSNTYNLITNKGWFGVLIEADKDKYGELIESYRGNDKVACIHKLIEFDGENSIDNVLADTPVPMYFDLLSIDIDGGDYYIWESVKKYRPRAVVIE